MCNDNFLSSYGHAHGMFLPFLSDHSPTIIIIPNGLPRKKKSFRFVNYVANKFEFLETIKKGWNVKIKGIHSKYTEAIEDEMKLLHQTAKTKWLKEGDSNSAFFSQYTQVKKELKQSGIHLWGRLGEVEPDVSDSWGWRSMLKLRDKMKPFIIYKIGNGRKTFLWYDKWCNIGPIKNFIPNRLIFEARFKGNETVKDGISNGKWDSPDD
nr:RNA-directed DNA polymerase, eukaryota, reverse transcriptase zinc-binding domain protein [Tanacetum cinerariifolium]